MNQETRRVKVYQLDDCGEWVDKGTGHVICSTVERNDSVPSIVVKSEEDNSVTLLQSKISYEDIYNRQQDTLIVWNEITDDDNDDGIDLALSFQDPSGCAEIWDEITDIQRNLRAPDIDLDLECLLKGEHSEDNGSNDQLPIANLNNLDEIQILISDAASTPRMKSFIAHTILNEKYLNKIIDLWRIVHNSGNKKNCVKMYHIFRDLVLLNNDTLLELIASDECIYDVLTAFEYDPESGIGPVKHSTFMKHEVQFKEVVPINNPPLEKKIHQTFRLQYIKDVALAKNLDEPTFNTINTMILHNNILTITKLVESETTIVSIFDKLKSPDVPLTTLNDCIKFLLEMSELGKNTDFRTKLKFHQLLSSNGLLDVLQSTLVSEDNTLRINSTQLLVYISETDPGLIRSFILKQPPDYKMLFILVTRLEADTDTCIKNLLTDIFKNITDTSHMEEGIDKVTFFSIFYQRFAAILFAPLFQPLPKGILKDSDSLLKNNLCDLLTFFIQNHCDKMSAFLTRKNVVKQVLSIINCREKFLALASLRFFRAFIVVNNLAFHEYIVQENLFEQIIKIFLSNGNKYNLLNSAILELFDIIRRKNMKKLINYFINNYWESVKDIKYCDTFIKLKEQHDKNLQELTLEVKNGESVLSFAEETRLINRKKFLQREDALFEEEDENYVSPKENIYIDDKDKIEIKSKKRLREPDNEHLEESPLKKMKLETS